MDWKGALAPGLDGVRLVVVTTLIWALNIKGDGERTEWSYLAIDILQVLRILAHQAGIQEPQGPTMAHGATNVVEGRKSSRKGCVCLSLSAYEAYGDDRKKRKGWLVKPEKRKEMKGEA